MKKFLSVMMLCGAVTLGACVDDFESQSVTDVRESKAEELKSIAQLNAANAEATRILAEADAALKAANAEAVKAQAALTQAQAELKKVEAELMAVEVERQKVLVELEKVKVEEEKVKLQQMLVDLEKKKVELEAAQSNLEATKVENEKRKAEANAAIEKAALQAQVAMQELTNQLLAQKAEYIKKQMEYDAAVAEANDAEAARARAALNRIMTEYTTAAAAYYNAQNRMIGYEKVLKQAENGLTNIYKIYETTCALYKEEIADYNTAIAALQAQIELFKQYAETPMSLEEINAAVAKLYEDYRVATLEQYKLNNTLIASDKAAIDAMNKMRNSTYAAAVEQISYKYWTFGSGINPQMKYISDYGMDGIIVPAEDGKGNADEITVDQGGELYVQYVANYNNTGSHNFYPMYSHHDWENKWDPEKQEYVPVTYTIKEKEFYVEEPVEGQTSIPYVIPYREYTQYAPIVKEGFDTYFAEFEKKIASQKEMIATMEEDIAAAGEVTTTADPEMIADAQQILEAAKAHQAEMQAQVDKWAAKKQEVEDAYAAAKDAYEVVKTEAEQLRNAYEDAHKLVAEDSYLDQTRRDLAQKVNSAATQWYYANEYDVQAEAKVKELEQIEEDAKALLADAEKSLEIAQEALKAATTEAEKAEAQKEVDLRAEAVENQKKYVAEATAKLNEAKKTKEWTAAELKKSTEALNKAEQAYKATQQEWTDKEAAADKAWTAYVEYVNSIRYQKIYQDYWLASYAYENSIAITFYNQYLIYLEWAEGDTFTAQEALDTLIAQGEAGAESHVKYLKEMLNTAKEALTAGEAELKEAKELLVAAQGEAKYIEQYIAEYNAAVKKEVDIQVELWLANYKAETIWAEIEAMRNLGNSDAVQAIAQYEAAIEDYKERIAELEEYIANAPKAGDEDVDAAQEAIDNAKTNIARFELELKAKQTAYEAAKKALEAAMEAAGVNK